MLVNFGLFTCFFSPGTYGRENNEEKWWDGSSDRAVCYYRWEKPVVMKEDH